MSNRCSQFTQSGNQCSKKTVKPAVAICEFGCLKHAPKSNIYDCGTHTNKSYIKQSYQPCYYKCANCDKVHNDGLGLLVVHPDISNFYGGESCLKSSDDTDSLGKKYYAIQCMMCRVPVWSPKKDIKVLCTPHSSNKKFLDQGLFPKDCFLNRVCKHMVVNKICKNVGWVEEKTEYWCADHQKEKNMIANGMKYTRCLSSSSTMNSNCRNYGWGKLIHGSLVDFWCENHKNDGESYKNGQQYNPCQLYGNGCMEGRGWIKKGEKFWCSNHQNDKLQCETGKSHAQCYFTMKIEGYNRRCQNRGWTKKKRYLCDQHKDAKMNLSNGLEAYRCESNKYQKWCKKYGWIKKNKSDSKLQRKSTRMEDSYQWWCPDHQDIRVLIDEGSRFERCKYNSYRGLSCCTNGFTEKETGIFWCDKHQDFKNKIESGMVLKNCKMNDYGKYCWDKQPIDKDEDYWCPYHQNDKEKIAGGVKYSECGHNNFRKSCRFGEWVPQNQNYWCAKHLELYTEMLPKGPEIKELKAENERLKKENEELRKKLDK